MCVSAGVAIVVFTFVGVCVLRTVAYINSDFRDLARSSFLI